MFTRTAQAYSAREGQKRVSDPLQLELQTVVRCRVVAGN